MKHALNKKSDDLNCYVGRQTIFNRELEVYGYELLFRNAVADEEANFHDDAFASSRVLLSTIAELGVETVTGGHLGFVNIPQNLLVNVDLSCLPPDRIVLELLEDIEPVQEVIAAVERLKREGYMIVLDDFEYAPAFDALVGLAEIVKIDLRQTPLEKVAYHAENVRRLGVRTLLAEKVESEEEFQYCREIGFDLFQGYFFCRPKIVDESKPLPHSIGTVVRLLNKLHDPQATTEDITRLISTDPTLSFRVLKSANSAAVGTKTFIETPHQAAVLLGTRRLRSLASMLLLASLVDDKPVELVRTSFIRARMCEVLAERAEAKDPERYFTVGLLSVLDAIFDMPMQQLVELLPVGDEMKQALQMRSGQMGEMLSSVIRMESSEGTSHGDVLEAYIEAIQSLVELNM